MANRLVEKTYPYAWLDEIVEVVLNPAKTNVSEMEVQQLEQIEVKFDQELQAVLKNLKENTFYLFSYKKIKATVTQYHDSLLLLEKQAKVNLAGYPNGHPLETTGENIIWYIQSMNTDLKKRYGRYIAEHYTESQGATRDATVVSKLLCKLSVDQMGIILKAADDIKLIVSRSLSMVFKSIVPYLSSTTKTELSWDSMRSNSYHPEESDKDAAIAALEMLIRKIRDYK
jgi:hypothetical protein